MTKPVIHRLTAYRLPVPVRQSGGARDAQTRANEAIVVALETVRGAIGYGETYAPDTAGAAANSDSITAALNEVFGPFLVGFHPESFPEALEFIEALPGADDRGRPCATCRAAVELALLDLSMRAFERDMDAVVRWMGLPGFGSPGSRERVRISVAVPRGSPSETVRVVRRCCRRGLRHFKLEVGDAGDRERLTCMVRSLRRSIAAGRSAIQIDAHGRWSKDEAVEWLSDNDDLPLSAVVQPLPRGSEDDLPILKDLFDIALIHDDSLTTLEDARRIEALGVADGFHVRIDKYGGLLPSLRLAAFARRARIRLQTDIVVGATDLSIAAGLSLLTVCPGVEYAETKAGVLNAPIDIVKKRLRFGFRRRLPRLIGPGIGVDVDVGKLEQRAMDTPVAFFF